MAGWIGTAVWELRAHDPVIDFCLLGNRKFAEKQGEVTVIRHREPAGAAEYQVLPLLRRLDGKTASDCAVPHDRTAGRPAARFRFGRDAGELQVPLRGRDPGRRESFLCVRHQAASPAAKD